MPGIGRLVYYSTFLMAAILNYANEGDDVELELVSDPKILWFGMTFHHAKYRAPTQKCQRQLIPGSYSIHY